MGVTIGYLEPRDPDQRTIPIGRSEYAGIVEAARTSTTYTGYVGHDHGGPRYVWRLDADTLEDAAGRQGWFTRLRLTPLIERMRAGNLSADAWQGSTAEDGRAGITTGSPADEVTLHLGRTLTRHILAALGLHFEDGMVWTIPADTLATRCREALAEGHLPAGTFAGDCLNQLGRVAEYAMRRGGTQAFVTAS